MGEIGLEQMLLAREKRVFTQQAMLEEYGLPLICFTLNIPGPVKVFDRIPEIFDLGCKRILSSLKEERIPVAAEQITRGDTGYEAFFSVDGDALWIKQRMVAIEDRDRPGRLFDIDVLTPDKSKLSREDLNLPPRLCLLCDQPAHACSRSRSHSVEELITHIRSLLASPEVFS